MHSIVVLLHINYVRICLLEKRALRVLLGLPRFVADTVLYLEAQILSLETRFQMLSVKTYLRVVRSPIGKEQAIFLQQPLTFLTTTWPRFIHPHLLFVNSILSYIGVDVFNIEPLSTGDMLMPVHVDNIFSKNAKLLPERILRGILVKHIALLIIHIMWLLPLI